MSKQKELAKSTFILTIGKVCTQFVSFLLLPLYTGVLTSAEYGSVDIVTTYTTLFTHVVLLGMDQAIFRFMVDVRNDDEGRRKTVTTAMVFALGQIVAAVILFACISPFVKFEYKNYLLVNVIASICVNMMLQTTRGLGDTKGYSLGSFLVALLHITGNVLLLVVFPMRVRGMLIAHVAGQLLATVYLVYRNKIYKYINPNLFSKTELRKIMKYSLPLVPNALNWWVLQASDRTIVMLLMGQAMSGQLTVAYKFPHIFYLMYLIFHMSWTESVALHMDEERSEEFFSGVIKTMFRLFSSLGIGVVAVLPFVFSILVKGDYTAGYMLVPLLTLANLENIISSLYTAFYTARKRTGEMAASSAVAAIINIVSHLLLLPRTGLYGAAVSSVIAYGYMAIYRYINVRKFIVINLPLRDVLTFALLFAVTCLSYYTCPSAVQGIVLLADFVICTVMNYPLLKSGLYMIKRKNREV